MNKIKKNLSILLFLGMAVFLNGPWVQAAGLEADLVLYNGEILTADTENPANFAIAEAVAIYDGKFVAVGSNQEALDTAGASTRRIDLAGKTVLPGLVETHLHVYNQTASHHLDRSLSSTDLPIQWTSKEEVLAQFRTLALSKKPGTLGNEDCGRIGRDGPGHALQRYLRGSPADVVEGKPSGGERDHGGD